MSTIKPIDPPAGLRACKDCPCWLQDKRRAQYFGPGGLMYTQQQVDALKKEGNIAAASQLKSIVVSACTLNPQWVETHADAYCWSQPRLRSDGSVIPPASVQ